MAHHAPLPIHHPDPNCPRCHGTGRPTTDLETLLDACASGDFLAGLPRDFLRQISLGQLIWEDGARRLIANPEWQGQFLWSWAEQKLIPNPRFNHRHARESDDSSFPRPHE